jgi:uncharacterized protein DUF3311
MGGDAGGDLPPPGSAEAPAADAPAGVERQHRRWAFVLFLLPVAAVVAPALYNRVHPELAGVPFFVWYQFTAVVFGSIVTGVVYLLRGTEKRLARAAAYGARPEPPTAA